VPLVNRQSTPATKPTRESTAPESVCYRCGKPGHFRNQCPLGPTVQEMDGETVSSEEDAVDEIETEEIQEGNEAA